MFSTNTGIKRSFYSQTGDFQFRAELMIDSLFGGLNVGVSGVGSGNSSINLNYFCNSGKILDNNSRFVGVYYPNEPFSISGNIKSAQYDYFINDFPVAYGTQKTSGTYNSLYLQPQNVNCDYNFFINGESPNLTINSINCFSGAAAGTGFIVNNNLPVTIYSGIFTNFSDNLPFSFSDIFTGRLNTNESGIFYVYPNENSVGLYTGNLQLITNGGVLIYNTNINITGSPASPEYSFNLNGLSTIVKNNTQLYTSNIICPSGSGIPIVVSLDYTSGSGSFFTTTGATGTFTWPYNLLITGYGTGWGFSGLGTGMYPAIITGTILAGSGTYSYSGFWTGNQSPIIQTGGVISLITSGNVTGYLNHTFTGSGAYIKSLTGNWNLLTGLPFEEVNYLSGGFYDASQTQYFNNYPAHYIDSTAFIYVQYTNRVDNLRDVVTLTVSGYGFPTGVALRITGNY